ncbi:uncharacterized, partial [Tachysurus ichikawai]
MTRTAACGQNTHTYSDPAPSFSSLEEPHGGATVYKDVCPSIRGKIHATKSCDLEVKH